MNRGIDSEPVQRYTRVRLPGPANLKLAAIKAGGSERRTASESGETTGTETTKGNGHAVPG